MTQPQDEESSEFDQRPPPPPADAQAIPGSPAEAQINAYKEHPERFDPSKAAPVVSTGGPFQRRPEGEQPIPPPSSDGLEELTKEEVYDLAQE
jgi:hypothetical protein